MNPAIPSREILFAGSRILTPAQFSHRTAQLGTTSILTAEDVCNALDLPFSVLATERDKGLARLKALGGMFICPGEAQWPHTDTSGVLRVVGHLPTLPRVAIVGARRADPKGLELAESIAEAAVRAGYAVVSGGALGIDAAAHRATLAAGGRAVAVFGSGLERISPRQNLNLFLGIRQTGAWVSPFRCEAPPAPWRFPLRNPWIAALSDLIVVVQAGSRSGALQTARAGLSLGRSVYAVPGNMNDPLHQGCHMLLSEGGSIMTSIDDCFRSSWVSPKHEALPDGPAIGNALWHAASGEPTSLSTLIDRVGGSVAKLSALAVQLEMSGWLMRHPSGGYTRGMPNQYGGDRATHTP